MRLQKLVTVFGIAGLLAVAVPLTAHADATTTVVTPDKMATNLADVANKPTSWFFYNDETDSIDSTIGSFVSGPATAPLGTGSAQVGVSGTQRRNLATYQFASTKLQDITELKFSTYNPSTGNGGSANRSAYLQFNVDFNGTDTWQRRLVFLPTDNGTVQQDTWKEWDAINNGNALWRYSGATWPVTGEPGTTAKTWNQILADYPNVQLRTTDSWLGMRVGEPYADGYTENLDKFVFATTDNKVVYDFEPTVSLANKEACKNGGWKTSNTPVFANQGECVSSFASSKSQNNPVQVVLGFFRSVF